MSILSYVLTLFMSSIGKVIADVLKNQISKPARIVKRRKVDGPVPYFVNDRTRAVGIISRDRGMLEADGIDGGACVPRAS